MQLNQRRPPKAKESLKTKDRTRAKANPKVRIGGLVEMTGGGTANLQSGRAAANSLAGDGDE